MSIALVAEVRDYAPADCTPAERLVLVWVADAAHDEDRIVNGRAIPARTCWMSAETLAARVGVSASSLGRVLQRLRDRGLEVRASRAKPGQVTVYRLPELAPAAVRRSPQAGMAGPQSGRWSDESPATARTTVRPEPEVNRNGTVKDSHSVTRSATPRPLPPDFEANGTNRRKADRLGIDLPAAVDDFTDRMAGERRSDWQRVLSAFLDELDAGRADETFPPSDTGDHWATRGDGGHSLEDPFATGGGE